MTLRATVPATIVALVCFATHAFAADAPPSKPTDAAGWRAMAMADVDAMRALLRDNTPIPFDTENPAYAQWLEDGHAQASARAEQVGNEAGYSYTLAAFANGFNDPHISLNVGQPPAIRWPGFLAYAEGDDMVVVQRDGSDPALPALGARIESCDGQSASALVRAHVLPFALSPGSPDRLGVPALFLDFQNPFLPLISSCSLRTTDGPVEISLRWRRISGVPQTLAADISRDVVGAEAPWGLTEPAPGVFWIGIPTFLNDEREQLRKLVQAVKERGKEIRNARAIVIDTRGNFGGATTWANRAAEAIFTARVLRAAQPEAERKRRLAADYRSSPGNLVHLREVIAGLQDDDAKATRRIFNSKLKDLERAATRKPPIAHIGTRKASSDGGLTTLRPHDAASPFPAKVYFLTNGSCVSACLSFADTVLMVPGVRLIGSATSGDTFYSEVRGEKLPSGLAQLVIPQEVLRGRGRSAGETYVPDIPYSGRWDDVSVRAWTLALIEAGR